MSARLELEPSPSSNASVTVKSVTVKSATQARNVLLLLLHSFWAKEGGSSHFFLLHFWKRSKNPVLLYKDSDLIVLSVIFYRVWKFYSSIYQILSLSSEQSIFFFKDYFSFKCLIELRNENVLNDKWKMEVIVSQLWCRLISIAASWIESN